MKWMISVGDVWGGEMRVIDVSTTQDNFIIFLRMRVRFRQKADLPDQ